MGSCPACRRPREEDAPFCPHCGHSLAAAARRDRAARRRAGRRLFLVVAGVLLVLALALRWVSDQAPGVEPRAAVELPAARAALAEGDWAEVIRLVSPTGEIPSSRGARALLAQALHERCLVESGTGFARAARVRELALADDPRDREGLRARAELESSFGDRRRAASWWEAALQAATSDADREALLLDAAVARALASEPTRAEILLEELLKAQPRHARALTNRGLLHLQAGRLGLAERDLTAALREESGLVPARAGLLELARRRGAVAVAVLPEGSQGAEALSSVTAHHARALLAEKAGDLQAAAEELSAALLLAPHESRLRAELRRIEQRQR